MKKDKESKSSKTQKGKEFEPKRNGNSVSEKSYVWPQENEEQMSMNIRMKPQPLQSSVKQEKKKPKK